MLTFVMVNAYGNDFLYVSESLVQSANLPSLARAMCDRHAGAGADGLIVFEPTDDGAAMTLFNADGGGAEVSGNGVRGLTGAAAERRSERRSRDPNRCRTQAPRMFPASIRLTIG